MCAWAAVTAADPEQLHALLASRTALVRAEALHALIVRGDLAVAEAALTDRHPLVREVAQAALRRAGSDPAEHYRRLAAQVPLEPSVIAGLGETGGPDDADVVSRWLSHPRARGRVEAIRALRRLGMMGTAVVVPLLHDESASVTRQAVACLRRNVGAVDPTELRALLGQSNPSHVRFAGYRLLTVAMPGNGSPPTCD
jgi:HEAT repeat protein